MRSYQTQIIPEDSVLPHLGTALDCEKMQAIFQQYSLPSLPNRITECRIERIKYKPQKNCTVCYRLIIEQPPEKEDHKQLVYARFYENGGSNSRYLKECGSKPVLESEKNSVLHITELNCVVWIFPYDRKLKYLPKFSNTGFISKTALPGLLADLYGFDWSIEVCKSKVIRYVPEHTCSVRADVEISDQSTGQRKKLVAYGKHYYNGDGERIHQIMRKLWDSEARRQGKLNIPEPIGYQSLYRMLWQHGVPGTLLSELRGQADVFMGCVAEAARQVAFLHQTQVAGCDERGPGQLRLDLMKVMSLLTRLKAPCLAKAEHLIEWLIIRLPALTTGRLAVLHGDLHLKNILADGKRVYLIDLDGIKYGDPLQDIGSFFAAILNLGMLGTLPQNITDQTIETFLATYRETAPWPVPDYDLRWHISAALVIERVFRSVARLKAGRMEILTDLVEIADRILEGSATPYWLQPGNPSDRIGVA